MILKTYELGNRREGQGYHLWVVTLALEPVTQRNHLLEGRADGPRPLNIEMVGYGLFSTMLVSQLEAAMSARPSK